MKKSKIRIFQKWSPKSKIRNGEALRLCLDCLPRLWRPSRPEIGNAPSLWLSPWKPMFLQLFRATRASELLELQSSFSSPKIVFWKCFSNGPIRSNMASDDFLDVPKWSGTHFRPPTSFGKHLAKKEFFEFVWLFWSNFCFITASKWSKHGYGKFENPIFSKMKP